MKSILLYLTAVILFISCDCYRVVGGKVIDKTTQQPLAGVKVCLSDQPTTFSYTDSTGSYQIYYVKTGLGCYTKIKKKVIAEKQGYATSKEIPVENSIELITDTAKIEPK